MPAFEIVLIFLAHIAVLFFGQDLVLGQRAVAGIGDDIVCKVQGLFENAGADIQKQTHAGRMPLKYQIWLHGAASSIWPMRSRRTLARVTSTPQRSQILPL